MKCWRVMLLVMALTLVAGMAHAIPPPGGTTFLKAIDSIGLFDVNYYKNGDNGGPAHVYNWTVGFSGFQESQWDEIDGLNGTNYLTQTMRGFALWDIPIQGDNQRLWLQHRSREYRLTDIDADNPWEVENWEGETVRWLSTGGVDEFDPDDKSDPEYGRSGWRNTDRVVWEPSRDDQAMPLDNQLWSFKLGFDNPLPDWYLEQNTWQRKTAVRVEWQVAEDEFLATWAAEVPEPMSVLLLGLGIPAVLAARSRRRGDD